MYKTLLSGRLPQNCSDPIPCPTNESTPTTTRRASSDEDDTPFVYDYYADTSGFRLLSDANASNASCNASDPNCTTTETVTQCLLPGIQWKKLEEFKAFKAIGVEKEFKFTGPLPTWLTDILPLKDFSIANNLFDGELPPFKSGNLTSIDISDNQFEGDFPLDGTPWDNLETLDISGNLFEGVLWYNFTGNYKLKSLDVSNNKFVGTVTDTLEAFMLESFKLSSNKFTDFARLGPRLVSFDGSNNMFTSIPSTWRGGDDAPFAVVMLDLSLNSNLQWSGWLVDVEVPSGAYVMEYSASNVERVRYVKATFLDNTGRKTSAEDFFNARSNDLPQWKGLSSLNLDRCGLGVDVDTFLSSIAHLGSLVSLSAKSAKLRGVLSARATAVYAGGSDVTAGFQSMLLFDLRNNELTGVTSAGPPEVFTKVQQVYLQQQRTASNVPTFTDFPMDWVRFPNKDFSTPLTLVDLTKNENLRLKVLPHNGTCV
jgi:hypothetical protein